MSAVSVRAVLWDADGVLQTTPTHAGDPAVQVAAQFPSAMTGAPIDEQRIRTVAHELGLSDRVGRLGGSADGYPQTRSG